MNGGMAAMAAGASHQVPMAYPMNRAMMAQMPSSWRMALRRTAKSETIMAFIGILPSK